MLQSNFSIVAIERIFGKLINSGYFFLIAILISKEDLGTYVWVVSIVGLLAGLLTGGIGKVISRRIANDSQLFGEITSSYIRFYLYLLLIPLFSSFTLFFFSENIYLYLYLGGVHAFTSVFVLIFKESFIGLERYLENSKAIIINIISKAVIGITGVLIFNDVVIVLLVALIISNFISFIYYFQAAQNISGFGLIQYNPSVIKSVFYESIPLVGVILFDSALSRFDTILLGSFSTLEVTGDYNFAYKIYEISWLPFAIIGTLVFPVISRYCIDVKSFIENENKILDTAKALILISIVIPFVVCLFWTPIMEYITGGKYGASNQQIIELLSLAIPFVAVIGLHWNILMALRRGKIILIITVITAILNIIFNIYLIEAYGAVGAAITNLISNIFQLGLYIFFVTKTSKRFQQLYLFVLLSTLTAGFIYYLISYVNPWIWLKIIFTICLVVLAYNSDSRVKILTLSNEK